MGLFDRLRGRAATPDPAPGAAPDNHLDPDDLAHMEDSLRERAQVVFATATEPFEEFDHLASDLASEGFPLERGRTILREEWDRRAALAVEHAGEDQSTTLRAAFAQLRARGVAAFEALGYDIAEGHDYAAESAGSAEGYVFFHHQDVERIAGGPGTLHLRYAATRYESTTAAGKYAEDEAIGRRVVAALEEQGLRPTWDGSGQSTITLEDLRWYPMPGERPGD